MNATQLASDGLTMALSNPSLHGCICDLRGFAESNPHHPMAEDIRLSWNDYEDSNFQNSDYAQGCIDRVKSWIEGDTTPSPVCCHRIYRNPGRPSDQAYSVCNQPATFSSYSGNFWCNKHTPHDAINLKDGNTAMQHGWNNRLGVAG